MLKIEEIKKEYDKVMETLSRPEEVDDWEELGEKKKMLEEMLSKKEKLDAIDKQIKENESILNTEKDEELIALTEKDMIDLKRKKGETEKELRRLVVEKEEDTKNTDTKKTTAILEIRAGAGGDEASLFATDLFKMYAKYAQNNNIDVEVLDETKAEQGGHKSITLKMKNKNPYSLMRYEGGVHRVQRVPETEKGGRIHTSTVSVAVLPEPKKGKVKINSQDLEIGTFKASGPGGQYVNKRETAIRINHIPTGIVVTSQNERSLQQNKEIALSILEAKIMEEKRKKREQKEKKERQSQIGSAMRAEKIRTYNFLQNRITDHRIEKSWHNLEEVLDGKLDKIINTLRDAEEREKYKDILPSD